MAWLNSGSEKKRRKTTRNRPMVGLNPIVTSSRKRRRRLKHLSVFSYSYVVASVVALAAATPPGGGILPPPPPPPPPQALSESSGTKGEKSSAKPHDVEASSISASKGKEKEVGALELTATAGPESDKDDAIGDSSCDSSRKVKYDSTKGISDATITSPIGTREKEHQNDQLCYPKSDQRGDGDALPEVSVSGTYYGEQRWQQQQQQQQQQQLPSWEVDYGQSLQPHNYEQDQYQTPYQLHHKNTLSHQMQQGQLTAYRRVPAGSPGVKSASRLLSLARKKLQTGIDSVSETLDSITNLTSRTGGKNADDGFGSSRHAPANARPNIATVPRKGRSGAGGREGSMPRQQGHFPLGAFPDPTRQKKPQTMQGYSQPVSKVYSSGHQEGESRAIPERTRVKGQTNGGVDGPVDEKNRYWVQHNEELDTADGDGEGENMMEMDLASTARPSQPQSLPPGDIRSQTPHRTGVPRPRHNTPQGGRRSQSYSSVPLRPIKNGGSVSPPTTNSGGVRKRYENYDSSSFGHKMKSVLLACVPRVPNLRNRSNDISYHDDGVWSDDDQSSGGFFSGRSRTKERAYTVSALPQRLAWKSAVVPRPVQSLLDRRSMLLSPAGAVRCTSVGRSQALLDGAQLALVVYVLHTLIPSFFSALLDSTEGTFGKGGNVRHAITSTLSFALNGWALHSLAAAILLVASNKVWIEPALISVSDKACLDIASEVAYAQLYLRVIASLPMMSKSFVSDDLVEAVRAQAVQIASRSRLGFFLALAIIYVLISTVAVLRPAVSAAVSALDSVMHLNEWKERPIIWKHVAKGVKDVGKSLMQSLYSLFKMEWNVIRQQPLRVAVVVSLLLVLVSVYYLPLLEIKRRMGGAGGGDYKAEEDVDNDAFTTSLWNNIGSSSATRLGILSSPRGMEGALEQFAKLRPDRAAAGSITFPRQRATLTKRKKDNFGDVWTTSLRSTIQPLLRKVLYSVLSMVLLSVPFLIYLYIFANGSSEGENGFNIIKTVSIRAIPEKGWVALMELAALLIFTHLLVENALNSANQVSEVWLKRPSVSFFFRKLAEIMDEVQGLAAESSAGADFQAMLTASPTKGIAVSDLWAAHSTRRAWAVKGSNVQCKNGEVVLIVGSDGAGKSRLLTAISEQIFAPARAARTTTYVRGSVSVAGVDVMKWDRTQLQKRVGVFLNDVRTLSDYASLMSGCTLEEILEPVPLEGGHISSRERNAMSAAMKITGLTNLIQRLPSKLSTVVNANEDELKPSRLRPSSFPLTPSDWTRVLLTKTLAQLISGNENQLSSPDTATKCMIGSIILLDDVTSLLSEVDEANLIASLRNTGAAILLTSNRWATGRFADRIVVVEDGSVVESGAHTDLMNLGPERSLYARHWSVML